MGKRRLPFETGLLRGEKYDRREIFRRRDAIHFRRDETFLSDLKKTVPIY